jgi:NADH-quinone oxidoreductase subunit L
MLVATLAIAGIPPFAGFFSKDEILWQTWTKDSEAYHILWFIGYATALMTAFYMFRLIYLTFFGKPRMSHEAEHHIHECPHSMAVPLLVLALFSLSAGWLSWPPSLGGSARFEKFLEPVFAKEAQVFQEEGKSTQLAAAEKEAEHTSPYEYVLMFLSVGAAAVGWGMARRSYNHADKGFAEPIAVASPAVYNTLLHKYYVDEGYDYIFTGRRKLGDVRLGVLGLGEASAWFDTHVIDAAVNDVGWLTRLTATISSWWDKWIIDGLFVKGVAYSTIPFSWLARLFEWGLVQWYALVMTAGLVGFVFYYVYH